MPAMSRRATTSLQYRIAWLRCQKENVSTSRSAARLMASVIVIQQADAVPTFCLVFALPLTLLFSSYDLSMVHEASESSVRRRVNW